jgi:nicotinamide mononucleotide transporter
LSSALQLLGTTPWEITATICAVAGVVLLARRNIYGWPLGIVWAAISAWLAWTEWQLVSDAILYASNIPILLICWFAWWRSPSTDATHIQPRPWQPRRIWFWLGGSVAVAITTWATTIHYLAQRADWIPEPDLLWRDSASTVLNYFAQALQGMRRMECWVIWLMVNLLGVHIYSVKGLPIYAIQYAFFLVLGIYGWWCWQRSLVDRRPTDGSSSTMLQ